MSLLQPTDEQTCVIKAPAKQRILVQAGPGTGKTEVVARRLSHLIGEGGLSPAGILVLSFSRSAVKALIRRIRSISNDDPSAVEELRYISVRTFDSWSFRMLRFLGNDPAKLLQNDFETNIRLLLREFDRLGTSGYEDLRLSGIRHIIIDEYQDLAGVRATLVRKVLDHLVVDNPDCGFTLLGDPNQAIYEWSARDQQDVICRTSQDLIEWVRETFTPELKIHDLTMNHRASADLDILVKKASTLLKQGNNPVEDLHSIIMEAGPKINVEDIFESLSAHSHCGGMAILCRYNSQILQTAASISYQAYQRQEPVPLFRLNAGTPPRSLPSWIAKLLYRYKGGQITKSVFTRVFRQVFLDGADVDPPCSGDPEAAWQLLLGYARKGEENTSLDMKELRSRIIWPDSLPDDEGEGDDSVIFTTIHQSKGLEYNTVHIVDGIDYTQTADAGEEGRVLFVGISRARDSLAMLELVDKGGPFYNKKFQDGHSRWHRWLYSLHQVELGCEGDVNQESIIRGDMMGGPDAVRETQEFLAREGEILNGSPVILEKTPIPGQNNRFHYRIDVHHNDKNWCLGFLHQQVTKDLLFMRSGSERLPKRIYNLRINSATTCIGNNDPHYSVPSPWRESRFWLSVCIHGIGQY